MTGNTFTTEIINNLNRNVLKSSGRNYSGRGWEGSNYNSSLGMKDITKIIRDTLKTLHPDCKFSVTKDHNSIRVALMSGPFDVFSTPDVTKMQGSDFQWGEEFFMDNWKRAITKGYTEVNQYYIDNSKYLNDKGKELFKEIYKLCSSFNYDDSDAMTDYFDTNFYLSLSVGKWDKPFIKTN